MPRLPDHAMFMKTCCFEESGMSNFIFGVIYICLTICKQQFSPCFKLKCDSGVSEIQPFYIDTEIQPSEV